jgi:Ca2+/H+ antiporter
MLWNWIWIVASLGLLYFGAEGLVRGSASLALRLGLTPLVIGLTVIAFGTSSPELVVSLQAAATGSGAMEVGNIIGSNICNIALILGLCALITPLRADVQVIRRESRRRGGAADDLRRLHGLVAQAGRLMKAAAGAPLGNTSGQPPNLFTSYSP